MYAYEGFKPVRISTIAQDFVKKMRQGFYQLEKLLASRELIGLQLAAEVVSTALDARKWYLAERRLGRLTIKKEAVFGVLSDTASCPYR
jgi:hypothetical protein